MKFSSAFFQSLFLAVVVPSISATPVAEPQSTGVHVSLLECNTLDLPDWPTCYAHLVCLPDGSQKKLYPWSEGVLANTNCGRCECS